MIAMPGTDGARRLRPRLWDYNYYVMSLIRRAVEGFVTAHVPPGSGARVVDLGCGDRPYEPLFAGRAAEYLGVDVGANPAADITLKPGEPVPLPDGAADVVISSQVLEHVVDVAAYLGECRRLLRPGGWLLLSTHGFWLYHPYPTDVRRWTCWGLRHEIEQHGFRVEVQRGCLGPLAYTTLLRLQLLRGLLYQAGRAAYPVIGACSAAAQLLMMLEDRITPRQVEQENAAVYVIAARRTQG
ncbi:MAG TPA: class I SAM-dependent methyltransferase [Gemmataceae bacterium]|nr:class I SAM-dependent methyltransferase [Gemmataceae bacterium]